VVDGSWLMVWMPIARCLYAAYLNSGYRLRDFGRDRNKAVDFAKGFTAKGHQGHGG